jgi:hypothetical protein
MRVYTNTSIMFLFSGSVLWVIGRHDTAWFCVAIASVWALCAIAIAERNRGEK